MHVKQKLDGILNVISIITPQQQHHSSRSWQQMDSFQDAATDCVRRIESLMCTLDTDIIHPQRCRMLLTSVTHSLKAAAFDETLTPHVKELLLMGAFWIFSEAFDDRWAIITQRLVDEGHPDDYVFNEPTYNTWHDLISDLEDLKVV